MISSSLLSEAIIAIRKVVGDENVFTQEEGKVQYGATTFEAPYVALGIIVCKDIDHIQKIVTLANTFKTALYPISGGKNWGYGNALPPEEAFVLDLSHCKKISNFDSTLGTVTLEPGVTQGELYEFLKKQKVSYLVPVHGGGPTCSIVGNALERGYGITPYADHFSAVMSLTAVLPNGELYTPLLHELGGAISTSQYKWGTGPYLDGLFTQGNFGIVTSMTIVLARTPKNIKLVYFRLKKDSQLDDLIPALRDAIRMTNGAVGSFNIMNTHRVISMTQKYPEKHSLEGTTLSEKEIKTMAHGGHITAWTGIGAIYGDKHMIQAAKKIIKRELADDVSSLYFVSEWFVTCAHSIVSLLPTVLTGKLQSTLSSVTNLFRILYGEPNEVALPLAYWRSGVTSPSSPLHPSKDGCGLYWYSPLIPFKEKAVKEYTQMVTRVCKNHHMEPLITLTTMSERCFDSTVPILFNKNNKEESQRAEACYYELFKEGQKLGFVPYRYNINSMHLLEEANSSASHFATTLKKAVDPNNIIAPGRYVFTKKI